MVSVLPGLFLIFSFILALLKIQVLTQGKGRSLSAGLVHQVLLMKIPVERVLLYGTYLINLVLIEKAV
jgi:hypothetical protein